MPSSAFIIETKKRYANKSFLIKPARAMLESVKLTSFFFNDTATTEIYTLSLHDTLPISHPTLPALRADRPRLPRVFFCRCLRSEEHTSELQSQFHLVCPLLLEKIMY